MTRSQAYYQGNRQHSKNVRGFSIFMKDISNISSRQCVECKLDSTNLTIDEISKGCRIGIDT